MARHLHLVSRHPPTLHNKTSLTSARRRSIRLDHLPILNSPLPSQAPLPLPPSDRMVHQLLDDSLPWRVVELAVSLLRNLSPTNEVPPSPPKVVSSSVILCVIAFQISTAFYDPPRVLQNSVHPQIPNPKIFNISTTLAFLPPPSTTHTAVNRSPFLCSFVLFVV